MSTKRIIARNVIYNWAGMAVGLLVGFVTVRLLVERLGEQGYGLWILIASLSGYFGLLDLGIRGSVGRNMAYRRAQGDPTGVNAMLSTALVLLALPGLLVLLATAGAISIFFDLFNVPPEQVAATRLALLLIGVNLALSIWLSTFDAVLWSMQRFGVLNAIDIPAALLRLGLTFALVENANGLPTLALITLLNTILAGGAKAWLSFRLEPTLQLVRSGISRGAARTLLHFGGWSWLVSITRIITTQGSPALIGHRLGVPAVAPFSVVMRLVGSATQILAAASGVVTPVATVLHATENHTQQQRLLLHGGKFCLALALYFLSLFLLLGDSFLLLWLGRSLEDAFALLVVLAIGESLPLGQHVHGSIIVGMGKHRSLACAGLIENALMVVLAWGLMADHGVLGMGLALAVPAFLCRGIFPLLYTCRIVGLPVRTYLYRAVVPAVCAVALPAAGLALLVQQRPPTDWFDLIAYTACFSLAYGASGALVVVPRRVLAAVWTRLSHRPPAVSS